MIKRQYFFNCSITEVEVVVGVCVILALTEDRSDEVEGCGGEGDAHPNAHAVVDNDTVDEETLEAAVHEVEEPLLGRVGAMMENVAASIGRLLVEVLLTIPSAHLGLWHAKTFTVAQTHVLSVSLLVVGKSASYQPERKVRRAL